MSLLLKQLLYSPPKQDCSFALSHSKFGAFIFGDTPIAAGAGAADLCHGGGLLVENFFKNQFLTDACGQVVGYFVCNCRNCMRMRKA
jgi:hypothetical protein